MVETQENVTVTSERGDIKKIEIPGLGQGRTMGILFEGGHYAEYDILIKGYEPLAVTEEALEGIIDALRKLKESNPQEWDALMESEHAVEFCDAWDTVKSL